MFPSILFGVTSVLVISSSVISLGIVSRFRVTWRSRAIVVRFLGFSCRFMYYLCKALLGFRGSSGEFGTQLDCHRKLLFFNLDGLMDRIRHIRDS